MKTCPTWHLSLLQVTLLKIPQQVSSLYHRGTTISLSPRLWGQRNIYHPQALRS